MRRIVYNCGDITTTSYKMAEQVRLKTRQPITARLEIIEDKVNIRPGRLEKIQAYFAKA